MNHLDFAISHARGKKCSLCQTARREYVAVTYSLGLGRYLVCGKCISAMCDALVEGKATLPVPKDFTTGVEGFARRHVQA